MFHCFQTMSGVRPCHNSRCSICSQILEGDNYKFNCGFVYKNSGDVLTCNSTDVIYVLRCSTCHAEYIGETNNLRRRMNNHRSDIRQNRRQCRATDHFVKCGTDLKVCNRFTIFPLERESDTLVRKAKESYYINLFLPVMNK